jgi:hypothetical protein
MLVQLQGNEQGVNHQKSCCEEEYAPALGLLIDSIVSFPYTVC